MSPRRRPKAALLVAIGAALALLCCGGGSAAFLLTGLLGDDSASVYGFGCGRAKLVDPGSKLPRTGSLGDEQMHNAAVIIQVGQQRQVPPRGWVIAIATALQESRLINLGHLGHRNDHDSLGLFQQRPSMGWGTADQVTDPEYAAGKFYEGLLEIKGWESMALTEAAQSVQKSAYPDAYAKHEPLATLVVNVLTDGAARAVGAITTLRCAAPGELSASGWTAPLAGEVVSGFQTPERRDHYGVDIAASKGTPIHAASAGIVLVSTCNAFGPNGGVYSCDRDGSPAVSGCGWYVDIEHAGNIITRYCHLVSRPNVQVGQLVAGGQLIGRSGSSGNSSGPHLHYEVHERGDSSRRGATDPVKFMQDRGAPLGVPAP